jgi:hypothetical protein
VALGSDAVQARLQLIQHLYKESLKGTSQALSLVKQEPLTAEEKAVLFAEVERAVWAFPEDVYANAAGGDWLEDAASAPQVRDALERAVARILTARK